jgi:NAD(P)-dependent dehydrogenase (short-subunit alcohol dehydrogenase family)
MGGKLDGKIVLITGVNSGTGLPTAKRFATEGANIFITGRREPELTAAAREIRPHVTPVQADISDLVHLDRLYATIKTEKSRPRILFANASEGFSANSAYSATKAAVRLFARTWTTDLKQRRIRINAVSPGSADTPGFDGLLASSLVAGRRSTSKDDRKHGPARTARYAGTRRRWCLMHPATAVTSLIRNYSLMVAWHRSKPVSDPHERPVGTHVTQKVMERTMRAFDLTGRVAIVTGVNGGIGLGMASELAQAGANRGNRSPRILLRFSD